MFVPRNDVESKVNSTYFCSEERAFHWKSLFVNYLISDKYSYKRYKPISPPTYGLNSTIPVPLQGWIWHLITKKVDMPLINKHTNSYLNNIVSYLTYSKNDVIVLCATRMKTS